ADSLVVENTEDWTKHDYGKRIREGNEKFETGDLSGAAQAFAEAATAEPDAFEPLYNLGSTLMAAGEAEQAASVLLKSAQNTEDPGTKSNALYNAGNAFMAAEKYQEAVGAYAESLRKNPLQNDAMYNLNRALEKLKQQQQEENQEEEQEEQEDKEDPKNDQDQKQEENPEDDESKKDEPQDDQQGESDQDDPQDEQQNEQGEPKDEDGGSEKNEPKEGGEAKAKMTPEQIKGLLEAVQRAEEKTAEKMTAKKAKGKKKSGEKDW
ncbi:MAG: tetratricopeptide repeat protein, partial [Bacteroidetes bacterium]|nr:tetratricopeptide repeat protein [Bacteroidota bacterium]